MPKVAVILSGCGYLDGAEIRESVLTLLYLDQQGADVSIFAPNILQHHVVNHLTQQEVNESRNVLDESARIARGELEDLLKLNMTEFDALVIPGGFGVAKNLSDLAFKGPDMTPNPEFSRVVKECISQGKPLGAICITPAVIAGIIKDEVTVTIGDDEGTAKAIETMGGIHQNASTSDVVADASHQVYSCSAYMREDSIAEVAKGIEAMVLQVLEGISSKHEAA